MGAGGKSKGDILLSGMNTGKYPYHFLKPGTCGEKQAFRGKITSPPWTWVGETELSSLISLMFSFYRRHCGVQPKHFYQKGHDEKYSGTGKGCSSDVDYF